MKHLIIGLILIVSGYYLTAQATLTADQIIENYQKAVAIESLSSTLSYKNISKKGRVQERELEQFIVKNNNGKNSYNFLLRFTNPTDVENTAVLTIQHEEKSDDQWLYLPVLKTAKRISANKKSDRFMGTEMSYEDLSNYLSEPQEEYRYELIDIQDVSDHTCYLIEAEPIDQADSQYSKRLIWIDQKNFHLIRAQFFDKKDQLLKVIDASSIKEINNSGKYRAHQIILQNVQTSNRTEVRYRDFKLNQKIDHGIFSKSYLQNL